MEEITIQADEQLERRHGQLGVQFGNRLQLAAIVERPMQPMRVLEMGNVLVFHVNSGPKQLKVEGYKRKGSDVD